MSIHGEKAALLFEQGYNCAQAIFIAFCDVTGLSEEQAKKLSASFGAGMGMAGEVCGAVTAMIMVFGAKYAPEDSNDIELKQKFYKKVKCLMDEFSKAHGTYICKELTSIDKSGCAGYVKAAAEFMDKEL